MPEEQNLYWQQQQEEEDRLRQELRQEQEPEQRWDDQSRAGESREGEHIEAAAITVGTTIVATTTIDAIMTSLFPTRSADLTGTPVYTWISNGPPVLSATWPASTSQSGPCCQLLARFEVHSVLPSTAGP